MDNEYIDNDILAIEHFLNRAKTDTEIQESQIKTVAEVCRLTELHLDNK